MTGVAIQKEKPITFSRPMVLAILAGLKQQTRRVVKLPHENSLGVWEPVLVGGPTGGRDRRGNLIPEEVGIWHTRTGDCLLNPYGPTGTKLWVREEHYRFGHWEIVPNTRTNTGLDKWRFVANRPEVLFEPPATFRKAMNRRDPATPAWHKRLARFMPRELARIFIQVVASRAERLQAISPADCEAEGLLRFQGGVETWWGTGLEGSEPSLNSCLFLSPVECYRNLWEVLHGEGSWEENPLVFVTSFGGVEVKV